ncbi:MAG TPA: glycine zipper family protein [Woeseiaceae bacterium]|nr:glycine zipper family protein [Woeseiaceae bacterium]
MYKMTNGLWLLALVAASPAFAQEAPSGKSLAATLEVYAFPKEGQTAEQQSKDETACYDWAVTNSGGDPFALQKEAEASEEQAAQQTQAAQQSTRGAGAKGAVRGAAAGALIGEIANDDASEGAAYGAAAGAVVARRGARRASAESQQQIQGQSASQQQATAEQIDNFKKAFSACLEGKDYMVKY